MSSKVLREHKRMIERSGLQLVDVEIGRGSHMKFHVRASDGREEFFVISSSGSSEDHAQRNNQAMYRRFASGLSRKHHHERKHG